RDPAVAARWAQLAALARMLSGPMAFDPATARTVNDALPARLRATVGTRPAIGFEEAMLRLGEAILPPPLVELADASVDRDPVRLVVSIAPGLSWLPLPLLAAVTAGGQVRHLVEFATISISPPWP